MGLIAPGGKPAKKKRPNAKSVGGEAAAPAPVKNRVPIKKATKSKPKAKPKAKSKKKAAPGAKRGKGQKKKTKPKAKKAKAKKNKKKGLKKSNKSSKASVSVSKGRVKVVHKNRTRTVAATTLIKALPLAAVVRAAARAQRK